VKLCCEYALSDVCRQVLLQHRQALLDQISKETNPATIFHSVLVTLYLKKHNVMIHATGLVVIELLLMLFL
jgi:hypothetical protein